MVNIKETFTKEQIEFLKTEEWMEFIVNNFTRVKKQELMAALKQSVSIPESMESTPVLAQNVEQVEKLPELETENYKIDTHLSTEEKLQNWRTKETDPNGVVYLQKDLTPEEMDLEKKAYVREYLEQVVEEYIWEQKFNGFAVDKLWLRSCMVKDYETFEKIRDSRVKENKSNHLWFMQKYFSKNGKLMLSGYRNSNGKDFYNIGQRGRCRLWDGSNVVLYIDDMEHYDYNPRFGFSVRKIKA